MRYSLLTLFCICSIASVQAQKFIVDTLMMNGPVEARVNLVFVGDGYQLNELDDFLIDAEAMTVDLFAQAPFKEYKSHFNVFAISVPSKESGAALKPTSLIDNYFGSTFGYAGIDRLLVVTKSNKVTSVLADNFPAYDQVFMVVNSTKYGGSGGWIATSSVHQSAGEIAIHEMGHSFADLRDEYWAGPQYALEKANMTQNNDPKTVRWKNWIGIDDVGVYAYPSPGNDWYKPHQACKMQLLGVDFCAVCKETITEKVLSITEPIISFSPSTDSIVDIEDTMTFSVELLEPDPNTVTVSWELGKVSLPKGQETKLRKADLIADTSVLKAIVFDETPFSKKDDATTYRQYTITWELVKTTSTKVLSPVVEEQHLVIYPNPTTHQISIEGLNAKAELRVVDLSGQEVVAPYLGNQLDVSALKAGVYVLQASVHGQVLQHQFVKE